MLCVCLLACSPSSNAADDGEFLRKRKYRAWFCRFFLESKWRKMYVCNKVRFRISWNFKRFAKEMPRIMERILDCGLQEIEFSVGGGENCIRV